MLGFLKKLKANVGGSAAVAEPISRVSARVIRADGSVEDLGVISEKGGRRGRSKKGSVS